jgi:hypothetical protein
VDSWTTLKWRACGDRGNLSYYWAMSPVFHPPLLTIFLPPFIPWWNREPVGHKN